MLHMLRELGPVAGVQRARHTLELGDGHSESPLESRGRGELILQGIAPPMSNVSLRLNRIEFRTDHWWDALGIAGEADGRGKYDSRDENKSRGQYIDSAKEALWAEKLRQDCFEEEWRLLAIRYVDREIRLTPHAVADRWLRRRNKREVEPWQPPSGLEVFQRPLPGSSLPIRWLRGGP